MGAGADSGAAALARSAVHRGDGSQSRSFLGASGGAEHFICVEAPRELPFSTQVAAVEARYAQAVQSLGLAPETAIFRRVFLSDVLNQAALVRESGLGVEAKNVVQPCGGGKTAEG